MQAEINRHRMRAGSVAVAIAVAAVMFAGCKRGEAGDAKAESAPAPTTVGTENVVVVSQAELASGPAISGNLQAAQEATVRAQIGGTVLQTLVDEGSRVSTGTLLARIDDRTIRDQYLSARSAVTSAQSAAEVAQRNLERNERLATAGAIADRDLETARMQNIAAQSQLADAKARLSLQEKQLADAQIRAPFTGIVSKRQVNGGDVVSRASTRSPIRPPARCAWWCRCLTQPTTSSAVCSPRGAWPASGGTCSSRPRARSTSRASSRS
jgi:multidrug efflux pump subunit AcrA (membrane-fusion protein)